MRNMIFRKELKVVISTTTRGKGWNFPRSAGSSEKTSTSMISTC